MKFLKKHWSNILLLVFIALLIIPHTRKPIQVSLNRLFAFSPSEVSEEKRNTLLDYNWKLKEIDGTTVEFSETEGEVAIVNLWATWCPPCIAEMPSFQSLYNDYGEKVNFYFISSEENEKLKKFMEKHEYSLPVFQPLSNPPGLLQSNNLPTTYVISKHGEVVVQKIGAADWNSASFRMLMDELVEENR